MNRLALLWNHLRASFWFIPALLVAACALLAIGFIHLDAQGFASLLPDWPLLFDASPDGARVVLSTIAGSMMTVVGVVYSMVLVTLSLAASQYSSRIIRNFMRDRATQVILGIYTGVFVYCLFVLRVIPGDSDDAFVPIIAVTFGVLLAIASVAVLIYFIHHIASALQASSVINAAARETLAAITRCFPPLEQQSRSRSTSPAPATGQPLWHPIESTRRGYIQSINTASLIDIATKLQATIRTPLPIGSFVVPGQTIASIATDPRPSPETVKRIRSAFTINGYRTVEQDPQYGIQQIVDIALRALSPGINDTNTATMCVDQLSACLAHLATRADPPSCHPHSASPHLLTSDNGFNELLDLAIDPVRESAEGNAAILLKLISIIESIAPLTTDPDRRTPLSTKLDDLAESVERSIDSKSDIARLDRRIEKARQSLR